MNKSKTYPILGAPMDIFHTCITDNNHCPKSKFSIPCIAVLFCLLFSSCSSIYSSFVNEYNIDETIAKEKDLTVFLENILDKASEYGIFIYERTLTHGQKKKTKLMHHRYYVINALSSDEYNTMGFFGTSFSFYSQGVWILNSNSDISAYREYLSGGKNWDIAVIETPDHIDTAETIKKLIMKVENRTPYYYKDHLNDKPGFDNCNTAIMLTLVIKRLPDNNAEPDN